MERGEQQIYMLLNTIHHEFLDYIAFPEVSDELLQTDLPKKAADDDADSEVKTNTCIELVVI